MPLKFDAPLKDLVQDYLPDVQQSLGLAEFGDLHPLNVDLSTLSAATDVALGQGTPPQRVVDLNFQGSRDDDLVARILMYNSVLYYRYGVPVHSVIVLLRPAADLETLTGQLRYQGRRGKGRVLFNCEVIRLWRCSPRRFLRGGLGALPLALLCQLPPDVPRLDALAAIVRRIMRRLRKEAQPEEQAKLETAAYVLSGLRVAQHDSDHLFGGMKAMRESTTYQGILAEGRQAGLAEGKLKGRIEALQEMLLRLGQRKFGSVSRATRAAVLRITDVTRLEQLTEQILDATSWQELLATA